MKPRSRFGVALGIGATLTMFASPRETCASVRTLTPTGCNPVHWAQTCVFVTVDSLASADVPLVDLERIAERAVGSWAKAPGSFLNLEYAPAAGPRDVAVDGWQTIVFRTDSWCRPATATDPEICYDALANAVTTITYVHDASNPAKDGSILDADIELNAVNAAFYDADSGPVPAAGPRRPTDLWNTLTHELGHLQGLDHTCRSRSDSMPSCARDDVGEPVALCDDVEADHAEPALARAYASTMYPVSRPHDTNKRTPEADDVAAIVSLYPATRDPGACAYPTGNVQTASETSTTSSELAPNAAGCNAAGNAADAWLAGFWLVGLVCVRRRALRQPGHAASHEVEEVPLRELQVEHVQSELIGA